MTSLRCTVRALIMSLMFQTSYNGVTKSTVVLTPSTSHDGRYLTCRAENPALGGAAMEDQWHLRVHCKYSKNEFLYQNNKCENISNKAESTMVLLTSLFCPRFFLVRKEERG